jgi:Dolichyl-phosphate-mannose-protein mannosyltransferase
MLLKTQIQKFQTPIFAFLKDIRVWILLLTLFHFENITEPPLDTHAWRQVLTMMVTRNFLEVDWNIFYPRIDITGELTGITGCEFPLFNYLMFIFDLIFGYQDWYGRLINTLVSCASLWYFYQIIKRVATEPVAFFSTLFLGTSIFFKYSRKTMPDTFSLALVIMGVYFAVRFLENSQNRHLLLSFLLITFGCLSKMPASCFLCFLIPLFLDKNIALKSKTKLAATISVGVGIMSIWYFAWVPYLVATYKYPFYWPYSLAEGWNELVRLSEAAWVRFNLDAFGTRTSFLVCMLGLGGIILQKQRRLSLIFAAYSLIFFFFILKTGVTFPGHEYYIIPYLPVMCTAAGYFIGSWQVNPYIKIAFAFLFLNMNLNQQRFDIETPEEKLYFTTLTGIVDKYVGKNEKIMTNGGGYNPYLMYWAHRKGWVHENSVLFQTTWMPDFKRDGLRYIVINRHDLDQPLPYPLIFEDANFRIYKP